ncbi:CBS domain-containing protein [bacterium]|nr:CBS domain-containing protein [bacterium]
MKVNQLMSKNLVKVTSITMVPEVAQKMRQENIGLIPVEDNGQLVGVVTDRDIAINAVAKGEINQPVKAIMTKALVTIGPNSNVEEAIQTMLQHNVRRLPVIDNGRLMGMVSLEDLTEAGSDQDLIKALRTFHKKTKHA